MAALRQQYLDEIADALRDTPARCNISMLAGKVRKPPVGVGKLLACLKSAPDRFELHRETTHQWLVTLRPRAPMTQQSLIAKSTVAKLLEDLAVQVESAHEQLRGRDELVRHRIESVLRKKWPKATVVPFGSAASALRVKDSDLDLCLTFPGLGDDKHWEKHGRRPTSKSMIYTIVAMLKRERTQAGMPAFIKIESIAHARVPIVKCVCSTSRIACDVVPHASLAVLNSSLLRRYGDLQPLCRKLILLVKMWANRRHVSSAVYHNLSSVRRSP